MLARLASIKLKEPRMAMVLGTKILLYGVSKSEFLQNEKWLKHELEHIRQFKQHGFFTFIGKYFLESFRKGYYYNKYEVEARRAEEQ
jgi:hypothetical protein